MVEDGPIAIASKYIEKGGKISLEQIPLQIAYLCYALDLKERLKEAKR